MVDFVLGRLRFKFKDAWSISTAYIRDDIVTYGGRSYVCLTNHTSSSNSSGGFYTDKDSNSRWELMNDGTAWIGPWSTSSYYKENDVIKYGGRVYICSNNHTSNSTSAGGFYSDTTAGRWEMLGDGIEFKGEWLGNTYYKINDVVKWGSSLYIANTGHTANASWVNSESNFVLFVGGLEFEDSYSAGALYQPGDVVRYGGYNFVATNETTGNLPTNTLYWEVLSTGFNLEGDYNNGTAYQPGDVVRYGAYTYVAKVDTTGNIPTNTTYWNLLNTGTRWLGDYSGATAYIPGDMVKSGGYLYVANLNVTGQLPHSNTSAWTLHTEGFNWNGTYSSANTYQLGDVVSWNGSSWISTSNNNSNNTPAGASSNWFIMAQGDPTGILTTQGDILYRASAANERLGVGANGQVLVVNNSIPRWENSAAANNVYYVSTDGTDSASFGRSLQRPWRTIKYATQNISGPATIFVKNGTYEEILPITVPANTAIMGDAQRTVIVRPAAGLSDDGITNNNLATMWRLSDGTLLKQMTFTGMTGFVPGSPDDDITAATIGGVFVRFNPSSPIATKSPYVLECSAISSGGVGVIVDGSVHASGNKSMVFHAYTILNNDGVGYYIKDNGRAEIVSCFTYYCWFGLATSGGGFIRGLNNNNSYGRYGAVSRGFDTGETPHIGKLYGRQLQFAAGSTMAFNTGEFITGGTSSANGIVTNVQGAANKLYYWPVSGTFQNSEVVTGVTTAVTATTTSSGVTGQKGYVIVANGFNDSPLPGRSIQFSDDANNAYVIQSVSGTYTNSNSRMVIVLSQEKLDPSSNAANVVVRANFSQIRLTGHDFLDIGTGNTATANVPGVSSLPATQGNEVVEYKPGRVYYVSTDQNGNFRVGEYFRIDQATGRATLDASAFDLSGLTSLKLGSIGAQLGETINEFSSDVTMGGNSNQAVPTEAAVKTYVDTKIATSVVANTISYSNTVSGLATSNVQTAIDLTYQTVLSGSPVSVAFSNTGASANLILNANGAVTYYRDASIIIANVVYNTSQLPTSWQEIYSGTTYTFAATYDANNYITQITRT